MSYTRHEAIRELYSNVVTVSDSAGAFDKDGKLVSVDEDKVKTKMAELKAAYDKLQYQRDRQVAYPSIEDQLDEIYHNGIDGWKTKIKTIKDSREIQKSSIKIDYEHSDFGEIDIKDIPRIKKIAAPHLVNSFNSIPHVTHHDEIDITEVEEFRKSIQKNTSFNSKRY